MKALTTKELSVLQDLMGPADVANVSDMELIDASDIPILEQLKRDGRAAFSEALEDGEVVQCWYATSLGQLALRVSRQS